VRRERPVEAATADFVWDPGSLREESFEASTSCYAVVAQSWRIGACASKFPAERVEVRAPRWLGYDVGGLMPEVDEERFPGLARYLAALPNGLLSYPAYVAKASLLRGVLELWGGADRVAGLPEPLLGAMKCPPPPNAWLPEVLYVAGHYAILDIDGLDSETILQLTYRANRRLTESPMYAVLAKVASPGILLRGAALSWGLLHRGVTLHVDAQSRAARLTVNHPPYLWTALAHESAARGFRAVLEAARGKDIVARVVSSKPTRADFKLEWR